MIPKWKSILLNWINCYFIEGEITEEYLTIEIVLGIISHLRVNLNLDESKSSALEAHTIEEFLHEKYPEFKFISGTTETVTEEELFIVTSLLLFFVCVNSKDIEIKNAMCSKLSTEDQEIIMKFSKCLMECSPVTYKDVQAAICEACNKDTSTDEPCSSRHMVSETPPALRSLHGEVRRLKASLDAERFDRNYLQEELSRTNLKVENLLKDKAQNKIDIMNLKAKISLCCGEQSVNRTGDMATEGLAKLTRQLHEAEERLGDIQGLLDDAQYERDTYKAKVTELKHERDKWLNISQQEATRCQQLMVDLENEKRLVQSLQELASELHAHRRQNLDSSQLECDDPDTSIHSLQHNSSVCSEACANVVEVQLAEERAKIVVLKQQIQMLQEQLNDFTQKSESEKLSLESIISEKDDDIFNLKHRVNEQIECKNFMTAYHSEEISKLNNDMNELEQKLNDSHIQSRILIETKMQEIQTLQEEKLSLLQSLSDETSKADNIIKNLKIELNAEKVSKARMKEEYENHIMKLNEKVLNRNNELVELQNNIIDKSEQIETLHMELRKEKLEIDAIVERYNNEMDSLKKIYSEAENTMKEKDDEISELFDKLIKKNDEIRTFGKQIIDMERNIAELNRNCKHFEDNEITLLDKIKDRDNRLQDVYKEIDKLNLKLEEGNMECAKLKSELEIKVTKLDEAYEEMCRQKEDYESSLKIKIKDIESIQEECQSVRAEFNLVKQDLDLKVNSLTDCLKGKTVEVDNLKKEKDHLEEVIDSNNKALQLELMKEKQERDSIVQEYHNELELINERRSEAENMVQQKCDEIESILKQLKDKNVQLKEMNAELSKTNESVLLLQKNCDNLESDNTTLRDDIHSQNIKLEDQHKVIDVLKKELEASRVTFEKQREEYENRIKYLTTTIDNSLEEIKKEKEEFVIIIKNKEKDIQSFQQDNQSLQTELDNVKQELDVKVHSLKQSLVNNENVTDKLKETYECQIRNLDLMLTKLSDCLKEKTMEIDSLKKDKTELEEHVIRYKNALTAIEEQNGELKIMKDTQETEFKIKVDNFSTELTEKANITKQLQSELIEKNKLLNKSEDTILKLNDEAEKLKSTLKIIEEENKELRVINDELKTENNKLMTLIEENKQVINKLNRDLENERNNSDTYAINLNNKCLVLQDYQAKAEMLLQDRQKEIFERESELKALRGKLYEYEKKLKDHGECIKRNEEKITKYKELFNEERNAKENTQKELNCKGEMLLELNQTLNKVNSEKHILDTETVTLKNEIDDKVVQIDTLKSQNKKLQQILETSKEEIALTEESYGKIKLEKEVEIIELSNKAENILKLLNEQSDINKQLQTEVKEKNELLIEIEEKVAKLCNEVEVLTKAYDHLDIENKEMQTKIVAVKAERDNVIHEAHEKIFKCKEDNNELLALIKEKEEALNKVNQEIKILKDQTDGQVSNAGKLLEEKQKEINKRESDLKTAKHNFEELEHKLKFKDDAIYKIDLELNKKSEALKSLQNNLELKIYKLKQILSNINFEKYKLDTEGDDVQKYAISQISCDGALESQFIELEHICKLFGKIVEQLNEEKSINKELQNEITEKNNLSNEIMGLSNEIEVFSKTCNSIQQEKIELQKMYDQLKSEYEALSLETNVEMNKLKEDNLKLLDLVREHNQVIEKLSQDIKEEKSQNESNTENLVKEQRKIKELEIKSTILNDKIIEYETMLKESNENMQQKDKIINKLNLALDEKRLEHDRIKAELENKISENKIFLDNVILEKTAFKDESDILKKEFSLKNIHIDALNSQIKELQDLLHLSKNDIVAMEEIYQEYKVMKDAQELKLSNKVDNLLQELSNAECLNNKLKSEAMKKDKIIEGMEVQLLNRNNEVDVLTKAYNCLEQESNEIKKNNAGYKDELEAANVKTQNELAKLNEENTKWLAVIEDNKLAIKKLNDAIVEQKERYEADALNINNKCSLLQEYQTKADKLLDDCRKEIRERETEVKALSTQLEEAEQKLAKKDVNIREKEEIIDEIRKEMNENNIFKERMQIELQLKGEKGYDFKGLDNVNSEEVLRALRSEEWVRAIGQKDTIAGASSEKNGSHKNASPFEKDYRAFHYQVDNTTSDLAHSSLDSIKTISDLERIIQDKNRTITTLQCDITYLKTLIADSENKLLDVTKELDMTNENCQQLSSQLQKVVNQKNEEIAELKRQVSKMSVTENRATQIIKVSAKYQAIIFKRIAEIKSNTVLKELTNFGNSNGDNELRRSLNVGTITMEDLENFLETTDKHLRRCTEKQVSLQKERDRLYEMNKIYDSDIINLKKFLTELSVSFKTFTSVKDLYTQKLSRVVSIQRTVRREILSLDGQINDASMCKLERGYAAVMQDLSECVMNLERWVERCISRTISTEKIKQAFSNEEDRTSLASTSFQNTSLEIQLEELASSFQKVLEDVVRAQKGEGAKDAQALTVMEVRAEYEDKLDRMKAKMKQLYHEQINAYKENQKKEISSLEHELQKTRERLAESSKSYEEHVRALTSELWRVGEKFLTKKNELDWLKKRSGSLMSLQHVHSSGLVVAKEEPPRISDAHSLRSLPVNNNTNKREGRTLHMSDEEGEVFDNRWLPEITTTPARSPPGRRISELRWRNSLCPPHLKSSYPAETQFAVAHDEDEIKCMGAGSLSGRNPRKEVGITAYKKPGPPTPSKQAGRLSATGSELRESLRYEPAAEPQVSRKTSTPSRLRALFRSNKTETVEGTPRSRRLSIFRKK